MILFNIETRQFNTQPNNQQNQSGWSRFWNKTKQDINSVANDTRQDLRSVGQSFKGKFQSNMNNVRTKINPTSNIRVDLKGGLNQANQFGKNGATFNSRLGLMGKSTAKLTSGTMGDRLAWNRGGAAKALGGNAKLTMGSKTKIGLTGAATGIAAGKVAGNIAQNRAANQAIKAGLQPGSPEYNKFVKTKTQGAKTLGRVVGAAAGIAGGRFLGKNTFKLVK